MSPAESHSRPEVNCHCEEGRRFSRPDVAIPCFFAFNLELLCCVSDDRKGTGIATGLSACWRIGPRNDRYPTLYSLPTTYYPLTTTHPPLTPFLDPLYYCCPVMGYSKKLTFSTNYNSSQLPPLWAGTSRRINSDGRVGFQYRMNLNGRPRIWPALFFRLPNTGQPLVRKKLFDNSYVIETIIRVFYRARTHKLFAEASRFGTVF